MEIHYNEDFKSYEVCKTNETEKIILDGQELVVKEKWISVDERLPDESTGVLVWCPERKNVYCAYYEDKQWWIFGVPYQKVDFTVKFWMQSSQYNT